MNVHQELRKRLLEQAGIFDDTKRPLKDLDAIEREQWNRTFERLMKNRLTMAYFRYAPIRSQIGKALYDNVGSIKRRLALYEQTRNREHLVDIANLAMVEFTVNPDYPFEALDDSEHTHKKERKE